MPRLITITTASVRALAFNLRSIEVNVGLSTPKPGPKKVFTPDPSLTAEERLRLIMLGGVTQKHGDKLEGDPEKIASNVVHFLIEKKIVSKME
jgi:hypothetical protein